ncbi:hypothetical protein D3C81_2048400 [compost metagenome]
MMAESDFRRAQLGGGAIQNTAAQTRTQGAGGFPFRDLFFDDAVGILFDNLIFDALLLKVFRQDVLREARLFLIKIDRHQGKVHRCALLQIAKDLQHRVAVFTA